MKKLCFGIDESPVIAFGLPQVCSNRLVSCCTLSCFHTPASKKRGVYCFSSVCPSVHNQYFLSHFFQKQCITATLKLVLCFGQGSYMSLTEFRSASYPHPVSWLCSFLDSASWDSGGILIDYKLTGFCFSILRP